MSEFQLVMPKMGESIAEATIIRWTKNEGDSIALDETVLEIATDKVDSEVPSPKAGTLVKRLFNEGDVVPVNAPIAIIQLAGSAPVAAAKPAAPVQAAVAAPVKEIMSQVEAAKAALSSNTGARFYSPLVLNIAKTENISMQELEGIQGSGAEGRVTKRDIMSFLENRANAPVSVPAPVVAAPVQTAPAAPAVKAAPSVSLNGGDEIIEMDRMRKLIADHMVMSKHTSPHVTSFVEADVTNMVLWREKIKKDYEKREGDKITFTPLFIEATIKCLKKYGWLNSSVEGNNIIIKKDINIGMATALPSGNLIVPVIKNADQLNLVGLTRQVNHLANTARNGKLKPEDTQGGTFTITNVGTFGSIMGTPIINQPQVAIMATGAIKKRPMVIETAQGDSIAIRHMVYLSLSYDHRIIDGALGATFLSAVVQELENFDVNRDY